MLLGWTPCFVDLGGGPGQLCFSCPFWRLCLQFQAWLCQCQPSENRLLHHVGVCSPCLHHLAMETAAEEGCCGSRVERVHNPLALKHHCLVTRHVIHVIQMATRCGSYLDLCNSLSFRHSPADLQGKTSVLCEVIIVAAVVKQHQDITLPHNSAGCIKTS